jgi:hypothetical protein
MDIGLHCFYEVSSLGSFASEGFWECSHHSDVSLQLQDLLWGCGWSLRGRGLSSSSSTSTTWVSSRTSSTGVSLHAFVPGMFNASAWVVCSSCCSRLYCYSWGCCCLRHRRISEWYLQRWRCVDWALSDCMLSFYSSLLRSSSISDWCSLRGLSGSLSYLSTSCTLLPR